MDGILNVNSVMKFTCIAATSSSFSLTESPKVAGFFESKFSFGKQQKTIIDWTTPIFGFQMTSLQPVILKC
jgi:hypothetical protein